MALAATVTQVELDAAEIPRPLTPHEARHCAASYLIAADLNAKQLSVYVGHSDIRTTYSRYRDSGVPLVNMRPVVDVLREELQTPYPLASARTWLEPHGRELVAKAQEDVGLERPLNLVVVRTGQAILEWTPPAGAFLRSVEWTTANGASQPRLVRPVADLEDVVIDPLRGFGEPVVRNVRTEIIGELVRAGDSPDMIAELYELPRSTVDAAVRYELLRSG